MQLAVLCHDATDEQRRVGKMAAIHVLMAANITQIEAFAAQKLWHAWEEVGNPDENEDELPDAEVCMIVRLLRDAEAAANSAMGFPAGDPHAVLDWVDS